LLADAAQLAKECDIALVFARDFETEGDDRANIALPEEQDEMIKAVVEANRRTIVVLNTGCVVLVNRWADDVSAIVQAWYPGQDDGNIIADVLFGAVNPSGRLPITFPRSRQDVAVSIAEQYPGLNGIGRYSEGIFIGYRHFDQNNIAPQFPFGHGLSYTKFEYSDLKMIKPKDSKSIVAAEFAVKNTGTRDGAEVTQLYVQHLEPRLPRPMKELKGFRKIFLKAREKQTVSIPLDRRAFAFYDPEQRRWTAERGNFRILIGGSSRDVRLQADYRLEQTSTEK
jgi:beta-glucosidase